MTTDGQRPNGERLIGGVLLSADEQVILQRLVEDRGHKEIAEELHISATLLKNYRLPQLSRRLGITPAPLSKVKLIVWAVQHGFAETAT